MQIIRYATKQDIQYLKDNHFNLTEFLKYLKYRLDNYSDIREDLKPIKIIIPDE